MKNDKMICKLCGNIFDYNDMSEEHYPARSVGNEDIVALDLIKMFETLMSKEKLESTHNQILKGESIEDISGEIVDNELVQSLYPNGRTARTLCRDCNTFLGKYDAAYLKFFLNNGDAKIIKGFTKNTKLRIIKSIFAKFISIPETQDEKFDFIDFLKEESATEYAGKWRMYFVRRNSTSDIMGLKDIGTGKASFEEGVVYELSDEKFIYNLMNFDKHDCYKMTNLFDILKKDYVVVDEAESNGGYHEGILLARLLSEMS